MTKPPNQGGFFFRGPHDIVTGSGGSFQIMFANGFGVSVANMTAPLSDREAALPFTYRYEVAIMREGKIINTGTLRDHEDVESFVTPARVLAIMLETALRTD